MEIKKSYTNEEIINYCNNREKNILSSTKLIDQRIIDELFAVKKLFAICTQKYFNQFEVDIYASIEVAKIVCDKYELCKYLKSDKYDKQFRNIIRYFVTRFNINSDNNFYEIEEIESSYFKIQNYDNNEEFNVRRMFPKNKNEFNDDPNFIHELLGMNYQEDDIELINKDIIRLSDYYNKYGSYRSFGDIYFCSSLDWYSKKMEEYNLNIQEDFKLTINRLPINLYDQDNINLYFENVTEKVVIEDVFFYHDFVFKLYGKETDKSIYQEVNENNYYRFSKFLLIANTKSGVAIYESSSGLKKYDNIIVDNEKDIILEKDTIYLKSKKDYYAINLNDTFFNHGYYSQYLTNNKHKLLNRPSLALLNEKSDYISINYIKNKKYYIFYIADDKSQKGDVLRYIINNLDIVEVVDNIFDDDTTINYKIYVSENDIETMVILDYLKRDLAPFKIYNISVTDLFHFVLQDNYFYDSIVPIYKKSVEKHDNVENNYFYKMQHVCDLIFEEIKKKYNYSFDEAIDFLNEKYINNELICNKSLNDLFRKLMKEKNEEYRQLKAREEYGKTPLYYDKYVRLLDNNRPKWKSEEKLYQLFKNLYNDSIYQYRDKWLGKQSLDIFVPSINTAIEYQGIQHYKEVDYFGGEEHLKKQKENDELKKKLCDDNNIKLIEWLYNDPISEILIKEKLGLISPKSTTSDMATELEKLEKIEKNKNDNYNNILSYYTKSVDDMEKLINSMKNIKETHIKELSHQTLLWCEAAISNYEYDLKNAKEILNKSNIDNINFFNKNIDEKITKIKNDMKYLRLKIIEDKSMVSSTSNENKSISAHYTIDDSRVFKAIDETLANVDISILEQARQNDINNGESTEILDKAITERKRRDEAIHKEQERQQKIQEAEDRKWRKRYRRAGLFGFLSGLFGGLSKSDKSSQNDDLMPWEEELVKKGEYEPYHFEEENTDEDDYYHDDLD